MIFTISSGFGGSAFVLGIFPCGLSCNALIFSALAEHLQHVLLGEMKQPIKNISQNWIQNREQSRNDFTENIRYTEVESTFSN